MSRRICLTLALVLFFLSVLALAQVSGTSPPSPQTQQQGLDCSNRVSGSLDPGVLRLEASYLKGLVAETTIRDLTQIMQKSFPGQAGTGGNLAALYVDPASVNREVGQGQTVIRIGTKTRLQIFGEKKDPIEKTDPCYKQSDHGVLTVRTAMPPDKARSMEDILVNDKVTLERCMTDLGKLEIVAVPMISRPDKDNPCSCEEGKPCVRVSTLTLVPSKVFDEKKPQPSGASTASFAAYPSDLRQEKQRLEKEAATLIEWLRTSQRDNQLACFTDDEVLLWAEDMPDALKRWSTFWSEVTGRIQQLKTEEDLNRKNLPPAPPVAIPSATKTPPAPPKKKSGH